MCGHSHFLPLIFISFIHVTPRIVPWLLIFVKQCSDITAISRNLNTQQHPATVDLALLPKFHMWFKIPFPRTRRNARSFVCTFLLTL
ncbi:hypothetical protein C8R41DRAFT_4607 [Lentinula lateritia]|uniref:Secreted protein n=1 Tax=Lentinula lateritia TaxID=40482 RepID=A0ABQ8VZY2_9AGAR|nr:hypothetical protein C8R41DRAFT_4607 [Lentinula lateritia]